MKNFASLPDSWQTWVTENLTRGSDHPSMIAAMVRAGHFDEAFCRAVIREVTGESAGGARAMPHIDASRNVVDIDGQRVALLASYRDPYIVVLGNVLTEEECDALVALCQPQFARSTVLAADGSAELHPERTSQGAFLKRGEDPLVARIDARLTALANWPLTNSEDLQVLRYDQSDEYKAHYDWFDPEWPGSAIHMASGGQRVGTFVLYLSYVDGGGSTRFPILGLEVMPQKGGAVFFHDTDEMHEPDRKTLHAGSPVVAGVKYVANKWLRASERV